MGTSWIFSTNLAVVTSRIVLLLTFAYGDGARLPDLPDQHDLHHQLPPALPPLLQPQHIQQPQQSQHPQGQVNFSEDFILSRFGFGRDRPLEPDNWNCSVDDSIKCFKLEAFNSRFSASPGTAHPSATQQRSLVQERFELSKVPVNEDILWDQLWKYALRRMTRFISSAAHKNDVPEELTKARGYKKRFIGTDINSELDVIEDKHAPLFTRKRLKKIIIPLLLVIKLFKLKLLLFLPFVLGLVGLKKILGLGAIILPGLFLYFKFFRHSAGANGFGSGTLSGLFGSKDTFPQYTPQGVGAATYYQHHDRFENFGDSGGSYANPNTGLDFSKPYFDFHSKTIQTRSDSTNAAGLRDAHQVAYSAYYRRRTG